MAQRTPHPDEVRESLRQLGQRRADTAQRAQADMADLGDLAKTAQTAGVPIREVTELVGASRQTVYSAMSRRGRGHVVRAFSDS